MLRACANKQIVPAIICSVTRDVMNSLPALKNPAKLLFCDKAVLIVPAAAKCLGVFWHKNKYVPILDTPFTVVPFLNRYVLLLQSVAHRNPVKINGVRNVL